MQARTRAFPAHGETQMSQRTPMARLAPRRFARHAGRQRQGREHQLAFSTTPSWIQFVWASREGIAGIRRRRFWAGRERFPFARSFFRTRGAPALNLLPSLHSPRPLPLLAQPVLRGGVRPGRGRGRLPRVRVRQGERGKTREEEYVSGSNLSEIGAFCPSWAAR